MTEQVMTNSYLQYLVCSTIQIYNKCLFLWEEKLNSGGVAGTPSQDRLV